MSIESSLYSALVNDADVAPLVSQGTSPDTFRVYPNFAPDEVSKPYIVYMIVFGQHLAAHSGLTDLKNARVQVDVYAESYAGVRTLADHVIDAVDVTLKAGSMTENSFYFDQLELHRISLDFSLWE